MLYVSVLLLLVMSTLLIRLRIADCITYLLNHQPRRIDR